MQSNKPGFPQEYPDYYQNYALAADTLPAQQNSLVGISQAAAGTEPPPVVAENPVATLACISVVELYGDFAEGTKQAEGGLLVDLEAGIVLPAETVGYIVAAAEMVVVVGSAHPPPCSKCHWVVVEANDHQGRCHFQFAAVVVVGSEAGTLLEEAQRKKLDDKSKKFIFIGYSQDSKGYKLYNPIDKKMKMFDDFKKEMAKEFEMTNIGLMSYYLGIEVKQRDNGTFISQEAYAKEVLKRFNMKNCNPISIPIERKLLEGVGEGGVMHQLLITNGHIANVKIFVLTLIYDRIRQLPFQLHEAVHYYPLSQIKPLYNVKSLLIRFFTSVLNWHRTRNLYRFNIKCVDAERIHNQSDQTGRHQKAFQGVMEGREEREQDKAEMVLFGVRSTMTPRRYSRNANDPHDPSTNDGVVEAIM
ncbi:hypothetical protein RJ639_013459 [Escallonia herrerae]|uniref:Reverse transcriptase Ty1/copia-type domain-containing protein n=1 Tax=Escallonia herrerae TaxID=1293975 RepID=A0AA88VKF0_9ASTE|nr:hypothetical protein RJ639_013459 [Escallonia herrerae]